MLNLNKNSWHAKLFLASYSSKELPKSLCNYFWSLIFAIILLPVTFVVVIYNIITKKRVNKIIQISFMLFGLILSSAFYEDYSFPTAYFYGLITTVVVVGISGLFAFTLVYFIEKSDNHKPKKTKKPNVIIEGIKAVKNKYCPIIQWDKED